MLSRRAALRALARSLLLAGAGALSLAPAAAQAIPSPGRIIPQIAAGGAWELELQVFNLTDQAREFELRFSNSDEPLVLPVWESSFSWAIGRGRSIS